ncbi:unnamed protein product [Trypanosoma congolense IL3000]|uniref:WGS project CAEQ00000000 data, annotated contig 249 n=1 Tax=Trypanosoma congolense (strain IL3000) TaxID=1068625 RepID=F9WED1_TRYCI|nr:unnamed protein product [Trypanosoma congolense IL3000]
MAGVHPYMALSPPAVLRVLAALAADVNPGYPFSIGDSFGVDGKLEECSFANADSNRNNNSELTQVMALLLASYDSVERLQYTYPTIRYVPPPTDTETGNPSNVVYPLDEFAVRARFVLLGAATDAVQCGHPWLECLSNRCAQTGAINIGNVCHCGLGEDIAPRVVTNDTSPSGGVALMRQGIECALRLPVCVMQDKLNEWQAQLDVCGTEHHRTTEGGTSHDTKKAQIPFLSSEVLSWVMKCVESVLELPNLYGMGKPAAASRMTSVQRSFESSVQSPRDTDGMGHRITAMAVVDECLNETTRSGASSSNNGTPALSYHWKLFLPHSRPFAVGTADIHRSTVAVDLFDTQSSGAQPEGLITAAEVIHFTLMHRLLADVGIGLKLHVRFCYDNEEDTLFQWGPAGQTNACAADRDNHSLLSSHSLLDCASEKPTAAPATATCVGREATLSLQLSPDFSGSLLWEALETAWTSVVTAVKVGAKDAQSRSLPLMESQKVSDVCQGAAEVCP